MSNLRCQRVPGYLFVKLQQQKLGVVIISWSVVRDVLCTVAFIVRHNCPFWQGQQEGIYFVCVWEKQKKGAWQGLVNVILPRIPAVPGTEIPLGRYVGIHRLSSGTLINYISPHVQ